MSSSLRELDSHGHQLGCPEFGNVPVADPGGTHADFFCDCHSWSEPKILANGTDIAWPSGWTPQEAKEWRKKNNLAYPSEPGSRP
jgi:hypothetical protein